MQSISRGILIPLSISINSLFAQASYAYDCVPSKAIIQAGEASFYGRKFHGKPTKSGEIFNMYAMTAASVTFPMGTLLTVTNQENGEDVIVRVNDTGAFKKKYDRVIDLSRGAADEIDMIDDGIVNVTIRKCVKAPMKSSLRPRMRPRLPTLANQS